MEKREYGHFKEFNIDSKVVQRNQSSLIEMGNIVLSGYHNLSFVCKEHERRGVVDSIVMSTLRVAREIDQRLEKISKGIQ